MKGRLSKWNGAEGHWGRGYKTYSLRESVDVQGRTGSPLTRKGVKMRDSLEVSLGVSDVPVSFCLLGAGSDTPEDTRVPGIFRSFNVVVSLS